MSSFTVTIVVPTAETESAFLMHAVQAALKAYRNHRNTSAHVNGNGLGNATHVAEKQYGQPICTSCKQIAI